MTSSGASAETVALRRSGAAVMSAVALVWALAGASGLPTGGVLVSIVAVGVTALVVVTAFSESGPGGYRGPVAPDWRRRYQRVGLVQALAIAAAVAAGIVAGRPGLIPGMVCLVVAAHFLPLARMFGVPRFLVVAAVLGAVAVAGIVVSTGSPGLGRAVTGLGAAFTLWWAALPQRTTRSVDRLGSAA